MSNLRAVQRIRNERAATFAKQQQALAQEREEEKRRRRVETERKQATLDCLALPQRKHAAKMLIAEAARRHRQLPQGARSEAKLYDLASDEATKVLLTDVDLLMRIEPHAPGTGNNQRDNYHFVKSELGLLRLWV